VIDQVNKIGHRVDGLGNRQVLFENMTTENFVQLHSLSSSIDKNLRTLATQVNVFNAEITKHVNEGEALMHRIVLNSLISSKIHLLLAHLQTLRTLYTACHDHVLSHLAVPVEQLRSILEKEAESLSKRQARFVFDSSFIESAYSFNTVQCIISKGYDRLDMSLSLPILPLTARYQVASFEGHEFLYQGMTCTILQDDSKFAISREGAIIPITSQPQGRPPVYQLPRHTDPAPPCVLALARSEPIEEVARKCVFHCERKEQVTVRFLEADTYTILNPVQDVEVVCSTRIARKLPPISEGRYQVTLPCGCLVQSGDDVIIDLGTACQKAAPPVAVVTNQWAELNMSVLDIFKGPALSAQNITLEKLPTFRVVTPPPAPTGNFYTDLPSSGMSRVEFWLWTSLGCLASALAMYFAFTRFCPTSIINLGSRILAHCCTTTPVPAAQPRKRQHRPKTEDDFELGPPSPAPTRVAYSKERGITIEG